MADLPAKPSLDHLRRQARMLLDVGADPNGRTGEAGGHGGWTLLRCAVAGAANPLITRLLLERGAVPGRPRSVPGGVR